jgi:hypothetical protein
MAGLGQAGHSPGWLIIAAYLRGVGPGPPTSPSGDAHQARWVPVSLVSQWPPTRATRLSQEGGRMRRERNPPKL